jgi:hypothetical protein
VSFNYFTGLNIVPTSEWTMDLKGAKQIKMVGLGDKRQITALLSVSKSGQDHNCTGARTDSNGFKRAFYIKSVSFSNFW